MQLVQIENSRMISDKENGIFIVHKTNQNINWPMYDDFTNFDHEEPH